jgi:hypothetical protein
VAVDLATDHGPGREFGACEVEQFPVHHVDRLDRRADGKSGIPSIEHEHHRTKKRLIGPHPLAH